MEMALKMGSFCELCEDEMMAFDGGVFPIVLTFGAKVAIGLFVAGTGIGIAYGLLA